jgi:sensor histidine kinase YesM
VGKPDLFKQGIHSFFSKVTKKVTDREVIIFGIGAFLGLSLSTVFFYFQYRQISSQNKQLSLEKSEAESRLRAETESRGVERRQLEAKTKECDKQAETIHALSERNAKLSSELKASSASSNPAAMFVARQRRSTEKDGMLAGSADRLQRGKA